jgi:8-oxo-dGTP pyrophosphatase MutT (NUDIX family)
MNEDSQYIRQVQTSVTCFIHHGDDYLFLHRNPNKRIDPNKLNGVGGRLEPGEDFLHAAIREVEEETGYKVTHEDIQLSCVAKLEGGYKEDWIMCFFKIKVKSKDIPHGNKTEDGTLIWLDKDKVLDSNYELVDDLQYCFKDIVESKTIVFFNAQVNESEKVSEIAVSKLFR